MGENKSIIPSRLSKKRKGTDLFLINDPNGVEQEVMAPKYKLSVKDHQVEFLRLIQVEQWIH